jgi:hypothetical protein
MKYSYDAATSLARLILAVALQEKAVVETAIKEAEEACKDGTAGECAAAWDNVRAS